MLNIYDVIFNLVGSIFLLQLINDIITLAIPPLTQLCAYLSELYYSLID